MKIKASSVKPGMVIQRKADNFRDISLVIATKGLVKIEYTHFDFQQCFGGTLTGTIDRKEMVKVITGAKRKHVIKHIKNELYKNLFSIERDIDTVWLIQAMDDTTKHKE